MGSPLREVTSVYVAASLFCWAITRFRGIAPFADYVHLGVAAVFLIAAIKMAQRLPGGLPAYGIDLAGLLEPPPAADERPAGPLGLYDLGRALREAVPSALRETGVALGLAALIFPPFALGFQWWHGASHEFELHLPAEIASVVMAQLLLVGLPEEAFFRGYLQTRLGDVWLTRHRVLGVELSLMALFVQALLFALLHFMVDPHPARLAVFFPGLLFGWLRAWRGGIGAALVLHAASNLYSDVLTRGWL